ncbi:putative cytochrome c biosynthesis protein [Capsicum annuum]|uniref:Cytochrome c biosynthesis protein n=1 Tax=Capsicum annuum TaxID=4072 RepID=A0A2G2Y6X1_CAPAN|nr:putative cytochrome c biosynthesis protein [Capsicum annuum]
MRNDAAEKNGTLLCSVGCVGSCIISELFTIKFKYVGTKCYPILLLGNYRSLLMLLRRCFFALSLLWKGVLVDTGRESGWLVVSGSHRKCFFYASGISHSSYSFIHSTLLHSWTSFLNIVTSPCCVSGTFSIRSGLLAPIRSFATDDTRGIFLWQFFLLMTGISMILFSQIKQKVSVRRTYKKKMLVAQSTPVHLRHSARAQKVGIIVFQAYYRGF